LRNQSLEDGLSPRKGEKTVSGQYRARRLKQVVVVGIKRVLAIEG
jgi:hypothetical protein